MKLGKCLAGTTAIGLFIVGMSGPVLAGANNVPTNTGVQRAATNAAKAGINLLATIASDAGVGNGAEIVSSTTVSEPVVYDVVTTTEQVSSDTSTSESNAPGVTSSSFTDVQRNDHGVGYVYKYKVTTTASGDVVTTTTSTTTTDTYQQTDTFQDTTTTTDYDELDPGKSQAHNKAPEEAAPADTVLVDTIQLAVGEPELIDTQIDVSSVEEITGTWENVTTSGQQTCNQGTGCPSELLGYGG